MQGDRDCTGVEPLTLRGAHKAGKGRNRCALLGALAQPRERPGPVSSAPRSELECAAQHQRPVGVLFSGCATVRALEAEIEGRHDRPPCAQAPLVRAAAPQREPAVRHEEPGQAREAHAVAELGIETTPALELRTLGKQRLGVVAPLGPLCRAPGCGERRREAEREDPPGDRGVDTQPCARLPFLVSRLVVSQERAQCPPEGDAGAGVVQPGADLEADAGLGVSAVEAHPGLERRGERVCGVGRTRSRARPATHRCAPTSGSAACTTSPGCDAGRVPRPPNGASAPVHAVAVLPRR